MKSKEKHTDKEVLEVTNDLGQKLSGGSDTTSICVESKDTKIEQVGEKVKEAPRSQEAYLKGGAVLTKWIVVLKKSFLLAIEKLLMRKIKWVGAKG